MSTNFVERDVFLNSENESMPSQHEPKRTYMNRFFYSKKLSIKGLIPSTKGQQQTETVDLKEEANNGNSIKHVETDSTMYNQEPRMKWDSISEYVLSIIGFVIDLGNVWR